MFFFLGRCFWFLPFFDFLRILFLPAFPFIFFFLFLFFACVSFLFISCFFLPACLFIFFFLVFFFACVSPHFLFFTGSLHFEFVKFILRP